MSLRIQTNVEAYDAHRNLVNTQNELSQSMQRLSSGYRINKAADDAAGLAISEKLEAQIGGLGQAQRNAQDATNLVQTAEGSLGEVQSMLQRIRDLAVEYNSGTLSATDKGAITAEVAQLTAEIQRISDQTQFNGVTLFASSQTLTFQVGADNADTISLALSTLSGAGGSISLDTLFSGSATIDISNIDTAIDAVSSVRANFGAVQNRMQHTLNSLATYEENLQASESSIKDVDMAAEMVNYTKLQVLQQAGTAMLAQANQSPQTILRLLQ